jgi:hypothetical protein
MIQT